MKITDYAALPAVHADDLLVVVDVHDTSMAATGTTKNMTVAQLPGSHPWQFTPNFTALWGTGSSSGTRR